MLPPFRLHAKFLVFVLGSLVLLLGIVSYVLVYRQTELLRQKSEEKQHILAFAVYSTLKENMLQGMPRSTAKLIEDLVGGHGLVRLEVAKKDGTPAFEMRGEKIADPRLARAFETGEELSYEEDGPQPVHTILYPLRNEQVCIECHGKDANILGVLVVSLSQEDASREITTSKHRLALFFAVLILALGTALYLLIRKVLLQPLDILHQGAERIGNGDLNHRIAMTTSDEFQDLAASMNLMASRLEESHAGLEQRVQERTNEVEDKARRLYEYSRDLAAISRLSTKVFNAEEPLEKILDRFMQAVGRGLGYEHSMLCLVSRTDARVEVKRDMGLGKFIAIEDQPIAGSEPFVQLVRSAKEHFVEDVSSHPAFSRYRLQAADNRPLSLYVVPILAGTHDKQCWQTMNCIKTDCPAYQREDEKCWLVAGTRCGNILTESFGDKLGYCMSCTVFPVLGVLIVSVPGGRPFRRHHAAILRVLAAEMGASLENHRLHDDNKQLVRQLLELYRVIAEALSELSLDRALEAFTESTLKFPGLDACSFWLLSEDKRELVHRAGGYTDQTKSPGFVTRLPSDQGVMGRALLRNQIIVEYNLPQNDPTELSKAIQGLPVLLALPLKTEQGPVGVLSIHKKAASPFLEAQIASFMLIANHAAMAINVCLLSEELKRQNRELARSTNLMGGILSSMTSGVLLLNRQGTVQLINETGASLLGLMPEDIRQRKLVEFVPDADVFLTSPVGPYQQQEITGRTGSVVPLGFSTAYYRGPSGEAEGIIVVFRDLTEIRALQAAIVEKERFATMGQVVAGVAHEIRNPLFGIASIGQIFERELTSVAHQELVRALLSESKRMKQLVDELLIYGRPGKLQYGTCNLGELWEEVIGMNREEVAKKGITITRNFTLGNASADLDGNQIKLVLQNLLVNAIDATPKGGEITVSLNPDDGCVISRISDTGSGIPVENLDKVFDLFYTTKPKGSGLGLAVSRKIVEDHGGEIHLESRQWEWLGENRGTTVTVKLPSRKRGSVE